MTTAIIFVANVIWAIFERTQGQSIHDQVIFALILIIVHVFRMRR